MHQQHEPHPAIRALINEKARAHGWHDAAEYAMQYLANTGQEFTADTLRDLLDGHEPEQLNAIGGLFMSWSRQNLIRKIGYRTSKATRRNGGAIAIWIGNHNTPIEAAA